MTGPLEGIRILDFTWALAGPFGSMILTDLGAEAIKIEPVGANAQSRGPGPIVNGVNTYFFSINRGKQSLTLDLKSAAGQAIVYRLVERVDVVMENFTPGTMERLGFGYEVLAARNPRLIYASTSGFGQDGPYRERSAVDVIVQGMSGIMSITGHPEGPPARPGYSIGDMAGGMFTAIGVLAALAERERSGRGQAVDVAMLDSQIALLENAVIRYFATGETPGRIGTRHPLVTPFQALPTADGYLVLAGVKDWELFCARIDRLDLLADDRFASNTTRTAHHAALEPLLEATFRRRPTADWMAELAAICIIAPLNTIAEAVADPQVRHRRMVTPLVHPTAGTFQVANTPVHLSRTPAVVDRPAPEPGEHTRAILRGLLDLPDAEIEALARSGVVSLGAKEDGE